MAWPAGLQLTSPKGVRPLHAGEPGEIGIVGMDFTLILNCVRRDLRVRRQISGRADLGEQIQGDPQMTRSRNHLPRTVEGVFSPPTGTSMLRTTGDNRVEQEVDVRNDHEVRREFSTIASSSSSSAN